MRVIMMTENGAYKAKAPIKPQGVVVHSTGCNNPNLSRYVAPDDGRIGKNRYNNHWNRSGVNTAVHAFVGKLADGTVDCVQCLPFNIACWGCGKGKNGSYNYSPTGYLQLEICEDDLKDLNYFTKAFAVAAGLVASWVLEFNIPIENVVSHHEAYCRGYASNHADCDHWLKKFGHDMDWFRAYVLSALAALTHDASLLDQAPAMKYVTVVKGDSLSKIAKANGITLKTIKDLNPDVKAPLYIIRVGQKIRVK